MKRVSWVHVKTTPEERQRWHEMAAARGVTLADLIRERLSSDAVGRAPRRRRAAVPEAPAADPALLAALARVGNNVNQLARWVNIYKGRADAIRVLAVLAAIERSLRALAASASARSAGEE